MTFQFAYLQVHSQFSPFGGLSSVESLAERVLEVGENLPIAAALTDTFGLSGWPLWEQLLQGSPVAPIAGAEVGISLAGRNLPYALVLLAYSPVGYTNLCRLVSDGLLRAGLTPLTATLDLETVARHREGLIAIAPYWGGPIMAALTGAGKLVEARSRAQALLEIFGVDNFFIGAPPLAAQSQPQTIEEQADDRRIKDLVRFNATLVKLGRELRIGLVGTGEVRYSQPDEARSYGGLRGRLQRALIAQYPLTSVQHQSFSQDWLYSFQAQRPTAELHLRDPQEWLAHYNERDWPGALTNNRNIAQRCTGWFKPTDWLARLRERCEQALSERSELALGREWLESELAHIADLGLAEPLLAAARVNRLADESGLVTIARRLDGSLVAHLLGLSEGAARPDFNFEAYTEGRSLRLEVGQHGRNRLITALNGSVGPSEGQVAGLAIADDAGEPAILHPRRVLLSLDGLPLADLTVLQPAQAERGVEIGAVVGPVPPSGSSRLEVAESSGVGRLQLTLDIANQARLKRGEPGLKVGAIHKPSLPADATERDLLMARLQWLRQQEPAAYFGANLQLSAEGLGLAEWGEAVRLEGISILKPDVTVSEVNFGLEDQPSAIRVGLSRVVSYETAQAIVAARQNEAFSDLDDFLKRVELDRAEIEQLAGSGALDQFGERPRLMASLPALEATSHAWQEWWQHQKITPPNRSDPVVSQPSQPDSEQLSLFGLFANMEDSPEVTAPDLEEPPPVSLAEGLVTTSRLEQLRVSRQILGFFTAEHPLWRQAVPTNSDAASDLPVALAELPAQTDSRPWLVLGLITGIRRLPLRVSLEQGQGEELTILQIEDFSGQAQLLVPRDTPAPEVQLEEGIAVAARVQRLKQGDQSGLVAVALAAYPALPGTPTAATSDDLIEPENSEIGLPATDEAWSDSLFASLEPIQSTATPTPTSAGPARNRGGKTAPPPPPKIHRQVSVHLPRTDSPASDLEMMNRLKGILRKHPGDDKLILFIPQPDGSTLRLEPQGLEIAYGPDFNTEIVALVGPNGVKLDEFSF